MNDLEIRSNELASRAQNLEEIVRRGPRPRLRVRDAEPGSHGGAAPSRGARQGGLAGCVLWLRQLPALSTLRGTVCEMAGTTTQAPEVPQRLESRSAS